MLRALLADMFAGRRTMAAMASQGLFNSIAQVRLGLATPPPPFARAVCLPSVLALILRNDPSSCPRAQTIGFVVGPGYPVETKALGLLALWVAAAASSIAAWQLPACRDSDGAEAHR